VTARPMQREPAVALSSSQRPWVADLMSYARDHAGVRVVGTVLSTRDALESDYDVLVIDDSSSFLSQRLVARVQGRHRIVIGVYDGERGELGRDKLLAMGVDDTLRADASPRDFLARIRSITEQRQFDRAFTGIVTVEGRDDTPPGGQSSGPHDTGSPIRSESEAGARGVVVVSGQGGATEVAVGLAARFARRAQSTVLVDFDTLEPAVCQRLGLDLTPNVFTAVESLRFGGTLDGSFTSHPEGFAVIGGLPSPREWEACRDDEALDLVTELAAAFRHVVVRVGRHLEDLTTFGAGAGRFGVSRVLVGTADHLVVVGEPSPTGVTATLAWIGDARTLSPAPVHVVMNRCARSIYQRGELIEEITRTFPAASVSFLPDEPRVRTAAWQGEVVAARRFTRALDVLVATLGAGRRATAPPSETPA